MRRRRDPPDDPDMPDGERKALAIMRREARAAKSLLSSNGKGGLPPSLVLGVLRRDHYRCQHCDELGAEPNGGVGVHHKGGVRNAPTLRLARMGKRSVPENLEAICRRCHDGLHDEDREGARLRDGEDPRKARARRLKLAAARAAAEA